MGKRNFVGVLCLFMVLVATGVVSAGTKPRPGEWVPQDKPLVQNVAAVKASPAYYPILLSSSMPYPWGVGVTVSGDQVYVNCADAFQIRKWEEGSTSILWYTNTQPDAGKWRGDIGFFYGDYSGTVFHAIMDVPMIKTVGSDEGGGYVTGLDIDPTTGTIYFIDNSLGRIYRLPNFDGHTPNFLADTAQSWGLAVKGDYIYISHYYSGTIGRMPKTGGPEKVFASGLGGPTGIDFDKNGNLYIADYYFGRILRINNGSRTAQVIASGFGWPFYVTVDGLGNVYFTDFFYWNLWKLTRKVPIKG